MSMEIYSQSQGLHASKHRERAYRAAMTSINQGTPLAVVVHELRARYRAAYMIEIARDGTEPELKINADARDRRSALL